MGSSAAAAAGGWTCVGSGISGAGSPITVKMRQEEANIVVAAWSRPPAAHPQAAALWRFEAGPLGLQDQADVYRSARDLLALIAPTRAPRQVVGAVQ